MKKKVLYFNFDVGGGIESCGNIFLDFLKEINNIELFEWKAQDQPPNMIDRIIDFSPDIIVLNEFFERSANISFYYKKFRPSTKIVALIHSWKSLFGDWTDERYSPELRCQMFLNMKFFEICDKILVLNYPPEYIKLPRNAIRAYFPVNDDKYRIKKEWKDRKNDFLYLGSISPLKLSESFIDLINGSNIFIDCYGFRFDGRGEYKKYFGKFDSCKNLIYKGLVKQEDVSDILNDYKYFVMPHDGYEIFNISLLQAIKCGTIPLVSNDRTSKEFDYTWIDWADDLYFGCNKIEELVENIKILSLDAPDHSDISIFISSKAKERFFYYELKEMFVKVIGTYINMYVMI